VNENAFDTDTQSQLRSIFVILILFVSFPTALFFAIISILWHYLFNFDFTITNQKIPNNPAKTVIITGGKATKAYVVARHLKQQNCRVIMVETHKYWMVASRFSKHVDRFATVPIPEQDALGYYTAIKLLAEEEKADLFIPVSSPVASVYDSEVEK
jgi:hypothetical protein